MHAAHQVFVDALNAKKRLTVKFRDSKTGREVTRVCAPLDYGPLRGATDQSDRYQLWNLEGRVKPLNITLFEADLLELTPLEETFEPAEIITWTFKPNSWKLTRDWGEWS